MLACVQLDLTEDLCWLDCWACKCFRDGCDGVRMLIRGVVCGGIGCDWAMCAVVVDDNSGNAVVSAVLCWLLAAVGESVDSPYCVDSIAWLWTMMLCL